MTIKLDCIFVQSGMAVELDVSQDAAHGLADTLRALSLHLGVYAATERCLLYMHWVCVLLGKIVSC